MKELVIGFCMGFGLCSCILVSYKCMDYFKEKNGKKTRHRRKQEPQGQKLLYVRQDQIEKLEDVFFGGMDVKMGLTMNQIGRLRHYLHDSLNNDSQAFDQAQGLKDILKKMKSIKLINERSYGRIETILQKAGLDPSPIAWNIGTLSSNVLDILNDNDQHIASGFVMDNFEYDAVIVHCEVDREDVVSFIENMEENLVNIPNLSLCTLEDFNTTKPQLQSLEDVFFRARYVFVYVTLNLKQDTFARFMGEMALTESLRDPQKNFRIIPIWTTTERVPLPELNPFPGFKYHLYFQSKNKKRFLDKVEVTICNGRKEIMQIER